MHFLNDTGHSGFIYLHQLPIFTAFEEDLFFQMVVRLGGTALHTCVCMFVGCSVTDDRNYACWLRSLTDKLFC